MDRSTEIMIMRHIATGDLWVLRIEHGGEMNGDHSFASGSRGPFRKTSDPLALLELKQKFRTDPAHLEWLEDERFERLDLVVPLDFDPPS